MCCFGTKIVIFCMFLMTLFWRENCYCSQSQQFQKLKLSKVKNNETFGDFQTFFSALWSLIQLTPIHSSVHDNLVAPFRSVRQMSRERAACLRKVSPNPRFDAAPSILPLLDKKGSRVSKLQGVQTSLGIWNFQRSYKVRLGHLLNVT